MNRTGLIIASILSLGMMQSGTGAAATDSNFVSDFEQADHATARVPSPARGSCTQEQAVTRFRQFLSHLDEKTAREESEKVYAPDAYLNDTLKTVRGSAAIRDYFIKTARGLDSMSVQFDDVAVSGENYYFRWTMDTRMKNLARGKTVRTIGMTLVRFDREGRVILHQDFWDSAQGVWEHVPVIGAVIRRIRAAL